MSEALDMAVGGKVLPSIFYPEQKSGPTTPLNRLLRRIEGAVHPHLVPVRRRSLFVVVAEAARHADACRARSDAEIRARAFELADVLRGGRDQPVAVGEMFALIREAAFRVLGLRHHDVQILGGYALYRGYLAEMNTGEGKTLTATLPAIAAALARVPVHVVTVNDYLAERDAKKLEPLYGFFGLSVGFVAEGMQTAARKAAYDCDLTYATNKQVAFDYLRDRLVLADKGGNLRRKINFSGGEDGPRLLMRGLHFAIVDEADSVLVDEARTPLILSSSGGQGELEVRDYREAMRFAETLAAEVDYAFERESNSIRLLEGAEVRLEALGEERGGIWANVVLREELTRQALTALHVMQRDDQYIVDDGKIAIVDEYTGRIMADRFWSGGLQQMVEIKEGLKVSAGRVTLARMTYQRFFSRYARLSGMSGTAREIASELWEVYRLHVVQIPPHRPRRLKRHDDVIVATKAEKWRRIASVARSLSRQGLPVLIGTRSVAMSMDASRGLDAVGVDHCVLNASNHAMEAELVAAAGQQGRVTVATNMAGRGTDIALGEGVGEKGGLVVIVSECHDSQRVDRQLIGRAARQGDPGVSVSIFSLEDEIFAQYAPGWLKWLASRALAGGNRRLAGRAMRRAQARAERRNAAIRRELLKLDTQLERNLGFAGVSE